MSFTLTENLALKKIKLLDVVLEGQAQGGSAEDNFDADVAIATGELGQLIPDLVAALGGPLEIGAAAAPTTSDKVMALLTGQPSEGPASVYAPPSAEDASAPF